MSGSSMRRRDNDRSDRGSERSSGRSSQYGRSSRRSRSPTPDRKRGRGGHGRRPMPDLTDVVSIDKRPRMKTLWDVKPVGYENVTTEMAKLSGLFPLPGAPRPIDYGKLQGLVSNLPGGLDGTMNNSNSHNNGANRGNPNGGNAFLNVSGNALKLESSRSAKRILITGFTAGSFTHSDIAMYFNELLKGLELENSLPDNVASVVQSLSGNDGTLVVLEFQTSEMATIALAFDGAYFQDDDSKFIMHIRRPADYITPVISALDIAAAAAVSTGSESKENVSGVKSKVLDSGKKISVAGIPSYLNDEQIMEVLKAFGPLVGFQMIKDKHTKEPRGIAFCEFEDSEVTSIACEGLNGMTLGDSTLRVKLASKGQDVEESAIPFGATDGMSSLAATVLNNNRLNNDDKKMGTDHNPLADTPVLQLLNMVTPEELIDNEEYQEILEDIEEECSKYGKIERIVIPRPDPKSVVSKRLTIQVGAPKQQEIKQVAGVGNVFIKFDSHDACKRAHNVLGGRKFSDRTVISSYYSEENFDLGIF